MSITVYIVSSVLVFIFSGILVMAGLGAAFLFVPLFYYLGVPLAEATPTTLLLNVVSLLFAAINYWRDKLINWRVGFPVPEWFCYGQQKIESSKIRWISNHCHPEFVTTITK